MNEELLPEDIDRMIEQTKESQKQKYLNGLKTPITVKCVVCDIVIKPSFDDIDRGLAEEYANQMSFANGAVGTISFGYGCQYDTSVFIIGICEHCYEDKIKTDVVLFTRSYMP